MINIIIPFYNSSKTLERTLASIESQTTKKSIVTIVNDASSFNEREQLSAIVEKSSLLIKIFDMPINCGVGMARQVGINNCNTDYLTFLDSDDVLMPDAVANFNAGIQSSRPDILVSHFIEETIDKSIQHGNNKTWMHGKVFRTSFLKENNISFSPNIRYNEDGAFCGIAFALAEKVIERTFVSYIWCNNCDSTVRGVFKDYYGERSMDFVKGRTYIFEELRKRNKENEAIISSVESLVNIYWMYLDIYNYSKDNLESFNIEVKKYLKTINYADKINDYDFCHDLAITFWEFKKKPYYGPLIPHITFYDYFNDVLKENKE